MRYKELEERILDDAEDKGLLEPSNLVIQFNTLKTSVDFLQKVVVTKGSGFKEYIDSSNKKIGKVEDDIPNGLGEALYQLIILAEINRLSLEDCLTEVLKTKKKNEFISKSN